MDLNCNMEKARENKTRNKRSVIPISRHEQAMDTTQHSQQCKTTSTKQWVGFFLVLVYNLAKDVSKSITYSRNSPFCRVEVQVWPFLQTWAFLRKSWASIGIFCPSFLQLLSTLHQRSKHKATPEFQGGQWPVPLAITTESI